MDLNLIPRVELKLSSMRRSRARQYSELTYVSLLEMFFLLDLTKMLPKNVLFLMASFGRLKEAFYTRGATFIGRL